MRPISRATARGWSPERLGPLVTSGNVISSPHVTPVLPAQTLAGETMRSVDVAGSRREHLEPVAGGQSPRSRPGGLVGPAPPHLVQSDDFT